MKKIALACLLLFCITTVAQQGINYKAVIKDGSGAIVANQVIDVQFTLLDGTDNVYEEMHAPTTDANGIVILNIGEGTPAASNVFSEIDWSSNDYYLNVQIDTGGGLQNMGTTAFKTVPYALYAKTSGNSNYAGSSTSTLNLNSFGGCMTYPSYGCASGTATITTTAALSYTAGMRVRVSESSNPALEFIEGVVQSYDGSTMVINIDTLISSTLGTFASWNINLGSGLPGVPGNQGQNGFVFGQGMSCRNFVAANGPVPIGDHLNSKILTYYAGPASFFDITLLIDSGNAGIFSGDTIVIFETPTNAPTNYNGIGNYFFQNNIPPNTVVSLQVPVFISNNVLLEISSFNLSPSVGLIEVCL
jgi:hypothetical protein